MECESSHPLIARLYDPATWLAERWLFPPHRSALVECLHGHILEIGAGTGAMFPYYATARERDPTLEFSAIEPDPHMRRRAQRRAQHVGLPITIDDGRAEQLPYPANSFDIVISSLVFCEIADRVTALDEVSRVLKPGGELRIFEHIADDGWRRRVQELVTPVWKRLAGGCHPARDTDRFIITHSSFRPISVQRFHLGVTPIRPFVRGRLVLPTS